MRGLGHSPAYPHVSSPELVDLYWMDSDNIWYKILQIKLLGRFNCSSCTWRWNRCLSFLWTTFHRTNIRYYTGLEVLRQNVVVKIVSPDKDFVVFSQSLATNASTVCQIMSRMRSVHIIWILSSDYHTIWRKQSELLATLLDILHVKKSSHVPKFS
jgi:hypothetical protein